MKKTADFVQDLREKLAKEQGKPVEKVTNYALAKYLNQTDTTIARWATGKVTFSDEMAAHFADLLDEEPGYVVACIHAERAASNEMKSLWERIAASMHHAAAAVLVLVVVGSFGLVDLPSDRFNIAYSQDSGGSLYIMSNNKVV